MTICSASALTRLALRALTRRHCRCRTTFPDTDRLQSHNPTGVRLPEGDPYLWAVQVVPLDEAVARFVRNTTTALDQLAARAGQPSADRLGRTVVTEAFSIATAIVDADG